MQTLIKQKMHLQIKANIWLWIENVESKHSALMRYLTKVWKMVTGPSRDDRAWSRDSKSA